MKKTALFIIVAIFLVAPLSLLADETITLEWDPNSPPPDNYKIYQRTEGQSYDYSNPVPNPPDHLDGVIPHPDTDLQVTLPSPPMPAPPAPTDLVGSFSRTDSNINLAWSQGVSENAQTYYFVARAELAGDEIYNVASAGTDYIEAEGTHYNNLTGRILRIVSGTGAGQIRRIASSTDSRIEVLTPFDIIPDSSSRYAIDEDSGDSNEVNHTVRTQSEVTRWEVYYRKTTAEPWTTLGAVQNTGQATPSVTEPLTAVPPGAREDVTFQIIAFYDDGLFSPSSDPLTLTIDRRIVTAPALRIRVVVPVN
jgi:hypothetical protein